MRLAEKRREVILNNLKELYDNITKTENDLAYEYYYSWASQFNCNFGRCVRYANDEGDSELMKILKSEFFKFSTTEKFLRMGQCEGAVAFLKRKVEELIAYLEITETKEPAPQNNSPLSLAGLIDNKDLLKAYEPSFNIGTEREYWNACLHALRHLETRIRKKGAFPSNVVGTELVTKAFNTNGGKFKIPSCDDVAEEEGFMLINRGMVMFHRNAKGHREGEISERSALKIIGYVDYLLNMLNTAVPRTNSN